MDRYGSTLSGDGDSIILKPEPRVGVSTTVGFSLTGTWSGVTAKLYVCVDPTVSPNAYAPVPSASYTSDTADSWEIPAGCFFKVVVSGSGSPLPSITYTATGEIDRA